MPDTLPLSVLDLAPIPSGSTPAEALRHSIDLARRAEDLGCRRYWLAEHHFDSNAIRPRSGIAEITLW